PAALQLGNSKARQTGEVRKPLRQRLRAPVEVQENEPLVKADTHRYQRVIALAEVRAHARRVLQAAIELIAPRMVGTQDPREPTSLRFVEQPGAAMPADVVEGANHAVRAAQDDDRIA